MDITEPITITAVISITLMLIEGAKKIVPKIIKGREEILTFVVALIVSGFLKYKFGEFPAITETKMLVEIATETFLAD